MPLSYSFKKAVGWIFDNRAPAPRLVLAGALTLAAPVYLATEAIMSDPSSERTPGIGDVQEAALEKKLAETISFARKGREGMETLSRRRVEANAEELKTLEKNQAQIALSVSTMQQDFFKSVMMSEGISEIDAQRLFRRYKEDFGDNRFGYYMSDASLSSLDECQRKVFGQSIYYDDSAATSIMSCAASRRDGEITVSMIMSLLAAAGTVAFLLPYMFALGGRFRASVSAEDRRRADHGGRPDPQPDKIKEATLKIRISQP